MYASKTERAVGERPNDRPHYKRPIVTTYYAYGKEATKEHEVTTVRSKWPDYATRNAFYQLTQNKYGAGVVVIHDESCFNELHCILTLDITGNIHTNFKRDPMRPLLLGDEK